MQRMQNIRRIKAVRETKIQGKRKKEDHAIHGNIIRIRENTITKTKKLVMNRKKMARYVHEEISLPEYQ